MTVTVKGGTVRLLPGDCAARQQMGGWAEDRLAGRCRFPIAPRNTASNLAYPLVGLVLVRAAPGSAHAAAVAFAVLLGALGLGSGLYHGFKTRWADRLDSAGMYAVFAGLTTYALAPGSPVVWLAMLVAAAAIVIVFDYVMDQDTDPHLGVFTAAAIIHGTLVGSWWRTGVAVALLGAAYYVWHLDRRPVPPTGLWGHAAWHVVTAAAIGLLFLAQA